MNIILPDRAIIERIRLTQPSDCDQPEGQQSLDITMVNNGAAHFARLKTTGWAVDGPDDVVLLGQLIKQLQDRADQEWNKETTPNGTNRPE